MQNPQEGGSQNGDQKKNSSPKQPPKTKKRRGRVKIEFIQNKSKRHTTFSKRKSGLMKKVYELTTLTGSQALLLICSEGGHVYTFATPKLQPLVTTSEGKGLIQNCLNEPDPMPPTMPNNPPPHSTSYSGFPPDTNQPGNTEYAQGHPPPGFAPYMNMYPTPVGSHNQESAASQGHGSPVENSYPPGTYGQE